MVFEFFTLNNGLKIPSIGFGTFETPNGKKAVDAVRTAIKVGYRLIDTASVYGNEESIGKAIKESGFDRSNFFITSKLWNTEQGYDTTLKAFNEGLKKLDTDYLDLYLIHWPVAGHRDDYLKRNLDTWRAFEKLYREGKIKAIGVSNFLVHHLDPLMQECDVKPMVNQLELNPQYQQEEIVDYCKQHEIVLEAWGPLMRGKAFNNELLKDVAKKYNKTIAQICIRWSLQKGFIPLPKSVHDDRIIENYQVYDFKISQDDMDYIDTLNGKGFTGLHPDKVDF